MSGKVFLDTNLWVYFYTKDPKSKHEVLDNLIRQEIQSILLSTQVLGELYNVLTKKKLFAKSDAAKIIQSLTRTFSVIPIDTDTVLKALEINDRYSYSYWDSLILATATLNDCDIVYSEDMQHNQAIENKTQILNPFRTD